MSLSASLANALTGLRASSRAAELVSSNVANAMTDGYGRKELALSARTADGTGAGVRIDGIRRVTDEATVAERRLADGAAAGGSLRLEFLDAMARFMGTPGEPDAFTAAFAALESNLVAAIGSPDAPSALTGVADAARDLALRLNAGSDTVQGLREDADGRIATLVGALNADLGQLARLNEDVLRSRAFGQDATALLDERQVVLDRIGATVAVRTVEGESGAISVYTLTGAALLGSRPQTIGFDAAGTITPDMTIEGGALSGLTLGGAPVAAFGPYAGLSGGALEAAFEVRDRLAVDAQAQLDALARDLVERFQSPSSDPTMSAGQPGLFTDAGAPFAPADEIGLSARIALSQIVDPGQGGDVTALRSGLYAVAPAPPGDSTILAGFLDALRLDRPPASAPLGTEALGMFDRAARFEESLANGLTRAENAAAFTTARLDTLTMAEGEFGVDTDAELQSLLLIEQTYAANARVIQTVEDLLSRLLEI